MAEKALEKLVSTPSLLIDNILLLKAHVPGVRSITVANTLLDDLF